MKKKIQKPFDAEAAKNGAKVETREGRSVRILCYDKATAAYPIVGLVNYESVEHCYTYTIEGKVLISETSENDLVIIEEVEATKFNVGDWLFREADGDRPWLITAITSDCYEIQDIQGQQKAKVYQTTIDKFYRLWTLKDAKPGDVLITEDDKRPFIFKEFLGHAPSAYCGVDTTDSIYIGTDGPWTRTTVRPATSNEKDMLFKKMEEEGYKWDAESLTVSKIQKRWRDDKDAEVNGYYIHSDSLIIKHSGYNTDINHNVFATEKQAKSALAMARISQIMANDERFGGIVTDEEWDDNHWTYVIIRTKNGLKISIKYYIYEYLAFHTKEQAELFLKENEDLVKDYYMMY